MPTIKAYVVVFGLCFLLAQSAHAKVVMVYTIQRHGARNVLPKTALLQESDSTGGPTLLPEGQRQAWEAGTTYRDRYINGTCTSAGTCLAGTEEGSLYGVVNGRGVAFSNYNLNVRSSCLDRTIMTALSFWDGALPPLNEPTATRFLPDGQQVVPVYSQPDQEDILIRAYSKCSVYQQRLSQWFASPQFQSKSDESAALRNEIAALAPGINTSLANWWNVYDSFNVWRTYGVGDPTPAVDNATFSAMQSLAYWLETAKMSSELTGNLLAGYLLADLLLGVNTAVAAVDANVQIYYKVLHLSGHYNTQLGVLAALNMDTYPPAADLPWLRQKIPSLAAVMAFEVVASGSQPQQYAVRLVIQDGPSATYTPVPLPCAKSGDAAESFAGTGACDLEAFRAYVGDCALNASQWCSACNDSSTSPCQLAAATAQLAAVQAQLDAKEAGGSGSCSSEWGWRVGVSVAVTVVGTAVLVGGGVWWMLRSHSRRWAQPMAMAADTGKA